MDTPVHDESPLQFWSDQLDLDPVVHGHDKGCQVLERTDERHYKSLYRIVHDRAVRG